MKKLDIPIRKNISKDEPLTFSVYKSRFIACNYGQKSIKFYRTNGKIDTIGRVYLSPNIAISSMLDSINTHKKDTSRLFYIDGLASIAHEMTHYFQSTYQSETDYIEGTLINYNEHVFQHVEIEAYAVEGYYFLYFADRKKLKSILKKDTSKTEKFKLLIGAESKLLYPNSTIYN